MSCETLESASCKTGNLKLIVITHGDSDHAGNGANLRAKFGTRIAMHRGEWEAVASGNPALNKHIGRNVAGIILSMLLHFFKLKKSDRFQPDVCVEDGGDLRVYGFEAHVLYLPGHSNGSIGVLTDSFELFCGVLMRNGGKAAPGFWMFDQAGFQASIEKLKKAKVTTVYPGHGKPFPMERFLNNHRKEAWDENGWRANQEGSPYHIAAIWRVRNRRRNASVMWFLRISSSSAYGLLHGQIRSI